jgi:hypothetical protein
MLNVKKKLTWTDEVINKGFSEVGQGLKVMSTGVNYFDDLINRRHGGSMDNQVAKDSCANTTIFVGGASFEADANVIRADGIGMKASTLQVSDGREGRHGEG